MNIKDISGKRFGSWLLLAFITESKEKMAEDTGISGCFGVIAGKKLF